MTISALSSSANRSTARAQACPIPEKPGNHCRGCSYAGGGVAEAGSFEAPRLITASSTPFTCMA